MKYIRLPVVVSEKDSELNKLRKFNAGNYPEDYKHPKIRHDCLVCDTCQAYRDMLIEGGQATASKLECGHTHQQALWHSRPCLKAHCRNHLYLEVSHVGSLRVVFPDLALEDMKVTCSLDVADVKANSQVEIAQVLNTTKQAIEQIESRLLHKAKRKFFEVYMEYNS